MSRSVWDRAASGDGDLAARILDQMPQEATSPDQVYTLGRLALAAGRHDQATALFLRVIDDTDRRGVRVVRHRSAVYCARAPLERNRPGDHEDAREMLRLTIDVAGKTELKLIVRQARALLSGIERSLQHEQGDAE